MSDTCQGSRDAAQTSPDQVQALPKLSSVLDTVGISISAICAIHCLALPIVLVAFPVLGGTLLTDEQFHRLLVFLIVPTSVLAILLGRLQHPDRWVAGWITAGVLLILVAAFWAHEHAAAWVDTALSVAGGFLLAIGHGRNFWLCRSAHHPAA